MSYGVAASLIWRASPLVSRDSLHRAQYGGRTLLGWLSSIVPLPSKTKLDQLGDRLRRGEFTDDDLRLLDAFRRSFAAGYEEVLAIIKTNMSLEPTGRPAKSTTSIIEKLQRETIRLTQIQDIAGCRLLVSDIASQEETIGLLGQCLTRSTVVDRRSAPSNGYRAVHVVATADGKPIEIQIRTARQHLWAEFSEKMSDIVDPSIKYGGGPEDVKALLTEYSELVQDVEALEVGSRPTDQERLADLRQQIRELLEREIIDAQTRSRR